MASTLQKLQMILVKKYSLAENSVTPEASLESLGLDSLDAIETLFDVEDVFDIRVPQDRGANSKKLTTVQDILDLIDGLVAEQRSAHSA